LRYLLVDKIVHLVKDESAVGVKNVTMSEDFLADHFPRNPVMPGALIVEAMVQLGSWLIVASKEFQYRGIVQLVTKAKFRKVVRPGDQIILKVELKGWHEKVASFRGEAAVDEDVAASADFELKLVELDSLEDPLAARDQFLVLTESLDRS
jgi:3-hydroxyacyl-[acyl-carrier-protein] dehydratase